MDSDIQISSKHIIDTKENSTNFREDNTNSEEASRIVSVTSNYAGVLNQYCSRKINVNQVLSLDAFYDEYSEADIPHIKIIAYSIRSDDYEQTQCNKQSQAYTQMGLVEDLSQVCFEVIMTKTKHSDESLEKQTYIRNNTTHPKLMTVIRGKGDTLLDKIRFIIAKTKSTINVYDLYQRLISYAMLRYYLWFLIEDEWDISILWRKNTKQFFTALARSEYALFVNVFEEQIIRGYDYYFVYSIFKKL
jgi:hypothetical protein